MGSKHPLLHSHSRFHRIHPRKASTYRACSRAPSHNGRCSYSSAGSLQIDGKSIPYELFSIIDGHGGSLTAQFIAAHMQQELEKALAKHGLSDSGVQRALKEAFLQLDAQAIRSVQEESGAVAVATLKIGSIIWTANLGDCRAILKVGEEVIQLSEDAKPDNPRFKKSIEKRGGLVINVRGVPRVNGNLAVARAFNDHRILGKKDIMQSPLVLKLLNST